MIALTADDLRPRRRDRLTRGTALAVLVHAVMLVGLSLNINWRSMEPVGSEAELWAAVPRAAAPRAVEPEPPVPTPPAPRPEPPQPAARTEPPPPPSRDADIVRERREEKEKLLEKQRLEDEREAARLRKAAERKQELAKAEADKRETEKRQTEKREAEKREAQRRETDKRETEAQKKLDAERSARIEQQRTENLKRIQGEAGASGAPGSTGAAAQSAGPSANWAGRVKARIKPNITFFDEAPANAVATVEVRLAPDGSIVGQRLVKSSGIKSWDEAVMRAVEKTEVLPRDTDGRVPSSFEIDFRPRDF